MSKKILIFSTAYLPLIGGAEVAVKEITQRLPDWQFDMITAKIRSGLNKFEKIDQVNVHRIGLGCGLDKFLLPIFGFIKAINLDKRENYNIIWSIMASQAGVVAAFLKIFYPAKKFLLTLQEGDPEEHLERYGFGIKFLYKFLIRPWHLLPFRKADYLTVISNDLKKRALKNKIKVPIEIVPNGVDVEKFKIARTPVKKEEKLIITASRLVKKNGIDDLIKAIAKLKKVKLLIMGDGSDRTKLEKLTQNLKIQDRVIFFGQYDNDELPNYLAKADVFVRPSLSEGQGISFLEAMAAGVPIIGTPVGGIPDFLKDPSTNSGQATGLFCQVRNSQSIAQKIKEILENDSLRETLIKNGQQLVQEKYTWDKIAQQMKNIFQNI